MENLIMDNHDIKVIPDSCNPNLVSKALELLEQVAIEASRYTSWAEISLELHDDIVSFISREGRELFSDD